MQSDRGEPSLNQLPPDTPPTVSYPSGQGEVDGRSPLESTAPPQHPQAEELPGGDKHPEGGWQTYNGETDQKQQSKGRKRLMAVRGVVEELGAVV